MSHLHIFDHPLIRHKLTLARNKDTSTKLFYQTINEMAGLMAYEITRDIKTKDIEIETPIARTVQETLAEEIIIVPIFRAGLGMVDGIRSMIPTAKVGHIGIYRDEETFEAKQYFCKLPDATADGVVLVVDPMLATGVSASAAISLLKKHGAKTIKLVCIVAAPQGLALVQKEHPDIHIYLAALDEGLNERCYIIPGLGDAGDRLFGTK